MSVLRAVWLPMVAGVTAVSAVQALPWMWVDRWTAPITLVVAVVAGLWSVERDERGRWRAELDAARRDVGMRPLDSWGSE